MSLRSSSALRCAVLVAGLAVLPVAGCGAPDERSQGSYDPRIPVIACLREHGVAARPVEGTAILAEQVRIDFLATPGQAEARQISGQAQGAEQIGRALVWVGRAGDDLLDTIEECVDE